VQRRPAVDLVAEVDSELEPEDPAEVAQHRPDSERVLGVGEVVGHADAQ
jgi:hypothetical protein